MIAPVGRSAIVLGQMFEAILCTFLEVAILCIVSWFFSVKVASGIVGVLYMILLIFLTAFFMSGLAYSISLYLPNEVIYETIINAIVLPIFFLSTALFPVENLSGGLAVAVMLNPFTYVINSLRGLMFGEIILFRNILAVILLFAVMSVSSFALAIWRLNQETVH